MKIIRVILSINLASDITSVELLNKRSARYRVHSELQIVNMIGISAFSFNLALIKLQFFYLINCIFELILVIRPVNRIIDESIYAISNIVFHGIEIGSIVLVADAISKEVS